MAGSILGIAALGVYGRAHRRLAGPAGPVTAGGVPRLVVVERPEDAYHAWKASGVRGRVLGVLTGRWSRVPFGRFDPYLKEAAFPPAFSDLSAMWERELDADNFLFLAAQSGIARQLVCVLPDQALGQLFGPDAAPARPGDLVSKPFEGFPRLFSTDPGRTPVPEPMLLYVAASFLEDRSPTDVTSEVGRSGWTSDLVILCSERGDERVSEAARQRLAQLSSDLSSASAGVAGGRP